MKKCKLCKANDADKEHSHIVSKFLGKGLFDNESSRAFTIKNNGKVDKVQDIPKESNIFCVHCEKRMEILETYFARKLKGIYTYNQNPNKFEIINVYGKEYMEVLDFTPLAFYMFFLFAGMANVSIGKALY